MSELCGLFGQVQLPECRNSTQLTVFMAKHCHIPKLHTYTVVSYLHLYHLHCHTTIHVILTKIYSNSSPLNCPDLPLHTNNVLFPYFKITPLFCTPSSKHFFFFYSYHIYTSVFTHLNPTLPYSDTSH